MRYSKVDLRKRTSLNNRICAVSELMDKAQTPEYREYYRAVMKQFQTQLESL